MNRKAAEIGLLYKAILRAVHDVYDAWGIDCTEDDLAGVVLRSGHVRLMIRTEIAGAQGEKKEVVYREIGDELGLSKYTVESIAQGRR